MYLVRSKYQVINLESATADMDVTPNTVFTLTNCLLHMLVVKRCTSRIVFVTTGLTKRMLFNIINFLTSCMLKV